MKCRMNGREVDRPCVISCELFGDCVAEYRSSLRARKPTNADCGRKPPMNNADAIVRTLRDAAENCCGRSSVCTKAADLIESMQALCKENGLAEYVDLIVEAKRQMARDNEISMERDERIESLQDDLARVTEDRDRAVADLHMVCIGADSCAACKNLRDMGDQFPCGNARGWCGGTQWQWRGVQQPQEGGR